VFPLKYEPVFYIPEDGILHSHRCENLKSYIETTAFLKLGLISSSGERGDTYSIGSFRKS
jgi:hypothetical protein